MQIIIRQYLYSNEFTYICFLEMFVSYHSGLLRLETDLRKSLPGLDTIVGNRNWFVKAVEGKSRENMP